MNTYDIEELLKRWDFGSINLEKDRLQRRDLISGIYQLINDYRTLRDENARLMLDYQRLCDKFNV